MDWIKILANLFFNAIISLIANLQQIEVVMAGMKITDHGFFGGSGSPKFPVGNKLKNESSAGDFGGLSHYEDTTEAIKSQQNMNVSKVHGHPQKPGHRN